MGDILRFMPPPRGGLDRHSALGPLADALPDLAPGVRLDELPFPGQIILEGRCEDRAFVAAVAEVLEADLPAPGRWVAGDRCEILGLALGRWLLVVSGSEEDVLGRTLTQSFARHGVAYGSLVDVSSSQTVFHLYGPRAGEVLARVSGTAGRDLLIRPGFCRSEQVSSISILLQGLDDSKWNGGSIYRIFVANSLVRSLLHWFQSSIDDF